MAAKMSLKTANADHRNLQDGLALLFGDAPQAPKSFETAPGPVVIQLPLTLIDAHPKQGRWSMIQEELDWLAANIAEVGVLDPVKVMQKPDGRYLLLSGHRRREASRRAGRDTIPAIVEPYDECRAEIIFNATNLGQRSKLRPSEKCFAYIDLEAAVKNGKKTTAAIAKLTGDNLREIQRYKRLANLTPHLLDLVDKGSIPLYAGVDLADLCVEEQDALFSVLSNHQKFKVSLKQAALLKDTAGENTLEEESIEAILFPPKPIRDKYLSLKLDLEQFGSLLPEGTGKKETLELIQTALSFYAEHGANNK